MNAPQKIGDYRKGFNLMLDFGDATMKSASTLNKVVVMFENFGSIGDYLPVNNVIPISTGTEIFAQITVKKVIYINFPFIFLVPDIKTTKKLFLSIHHLQQPR